MEEPSLATLNFDDYQIRQIGESFIFSNIPIPNTHEPGELTRKIQHAVLKRVLAYAQNPAQNPAQEKNPDLVSPVLFALDKAITQKLITVLKNINLECYRLMLFADGTHLRIETYSKSRFINVQVIEFFSEQEFIIGIDPEIFRKVKRKILDNKAFSISLVKVGNQRSYHNLVIGTTNFRDEIEFISIPVDMDGDPDVLSSYNNVKQQSLYNHVGIGNVEGESELFAVDVSAIAPYKKVAAGITPPFVTPPCFRFFCQENGIYLVIQRTESDECVIKPVQIATTTRTDFDYLHVGLDILIGSLTQLTKLGCKRFTLSTLDQFDNALIISGTGSSGRKIRILLGLLQPPAYLYRGAEPKFPLPISRRN